VRDDHEQMRRDLDSIQESLRKLRSDSARELRRLADDRAAASDVHEADPDETAPPAGP
jgi:hypothetical protein